MQTAEEALKTLEVTLEKYRKNKTMVSPEDLKGKYKTSFQKLKEQLKSEAEDFIRAYCFHGMTVRKDDSDSFVAGCQEVWSKAGFPKESGRAIFKDFDLGKLKSIAEAYRDMVQKNYVEYFNRHICLYAYGQCFAEENPDNPLIYNDLVDKFWEEETGTWIDKEKPPGDAILIFVGGKKDERGNKRTLQG